MGGVRGGVLLLCKLLSSVRSGRCVTVGPPWDMCGSTPQLLPTICPARTQGASGTSVNRLSSSMLCISVVLSILLLPFCSGNSLNTTICISKVCFRLHFLSPFPDKLDASSGSNGKIIFYTGCWFCGLMFNGHCSYKVVYYVFFITSWFETSEYFPYFCDGITWIFKIH